MFVLELSTLLYFGVNDYRTFRTFSSSAVVRTSLSTFYRRQQFVPIWLLKT